MIGQVGNHGTAPPPGPRAGGSNRQTEPAHWLPNAAGGLAFVPRRSADAGYVTTREALGRFAAESPLHLLSYLADVHPAFGLALWNLLRLAAPVDGVKIVAVKPHGAGDDAGEIDDAGTAHLNELWAGLPNEIGGLHGLMTTGLLSASLTGLPWYEAVPGPRMKGLRRVYPVDSLTVRMNREGPDGDVVPYQLQRFPREGQRTGSWVKLESARHFWRPLDNLPDDPYGRAPMAAALGEILRDLALMQDLTDAIHNAAWPRLGYPFDFAETYRIAKEVYGISNPAKASEWVMSQFNATVAAANKLKPSDNVHYDSSGTGSRGLETIEGSKGFSSLEPILVYLRQRITQAVKSLPTLLGINDGSTQTYTTVEWSIYAGGLETLRFIIVDLLVKIATLHLQLLGLPLIARAEYEPIRTTDASVEANTEATRISNAERKYQNGWITNDDASQEITGSDAVGEPISDNPPAPDPAGNEKPPKPKDADGEAARRKYRPGNLVYIVQSGKKHLIRKETYAGI